MVPAGHVAGGTSTFTRYGAFVTAPYVDTVISWMPTKPSGGTVLSLVIEAQDWPLLVVPVSCVVATATAELAVFVASLTDAHVKETKANLFADRAPAGARFMPDTSVSRPAVTGPRCTAVTGDRGDHRSVLGDRLVDSVCKDLTVPLIGTVEATGHGRCSDAWERRMRGRITCQVGRHG